jgi:hypothetical protein
MEKPERFILLENSTYRRFKVQDSLRELPEWQDGRMRMRANFRS